MGDLEKANEWLASTCAAQTEGARVVLDPDGDTDTESGKACDCRASLAALLTAIRADERAKCEAAIVAWLRAEAERWGGGRDVAAVGLETAANVIERGEHWTT